MDAELFLKYNLTIIYVLIIGILTAIKNTNTNIRITKYGTNISFSVDTELITKYITKSINTINKKNPISPNENDFRR